MSDNKSSPKARDIPFDASLRPATFSEFVGQERICQRLGSALQAAQQRGDVIEHILLIGPPGSGKTTLAYILAHAMGVNIKNASGLTIEWAGDLAGLLTTLERGDILFIDDIDRLQPAIEQYLYPAMEDYKLDIIIDQGPNARSIPLNVPRFTLIGATTRVDMLSSRLRSCFGLSCQFDRYTPQELRQIVLRSASILGVPIDPPGALEIATRAQGSLRVAKSLLRRVRDFAQVYANNRITRDVVDSAVKLFTGAEDTCEPEGTPVTQEGEPPLCREASTDSVSETRGTQFDVSLRPRAFTEFIGQDKIRQQLDVMVQAAQQRGDVIEHIIFIGPSGLGKTTLAHILAQAMGVNIKDTSGPTIEKAGDLAGLLTTLERGDVLFIDEIDRLSPAIEAYLYPAMKDFKLDIIIDQGPNARSIPLNLPRFTLIGATTRADMISAPLRSRFGMNGRLDYYTVEELQRIVLRSAGILGVPTDPPGALEIATRAQGTPRIANNLLRLAASHLRLKSAISHSDWCELLDVLTRELWSLAEARPDFEELPSWVAEVRATGAPVEDANQAAAGVEQIHTVFRSVVDRYGDDEDRVGFARMHSLGGGPGDMALAAADLAQKAATFRKGVRRLPLAIHNDQLLVGRHTRLSFNRTLRIPEDEREYPLPAGFGRLPILRVEDYAKRVPEQWLEQGGFIIPLYQREALFLEFAGVQWRPTIGKVSVGRVNAISGKEHDLKIRPHRQDYVVIPDQRWLDGINSGSGSVSQFVAMPLGKGYTVEAQITDEEKFGGFQLAIFDPRTGRFPEQDPKEQEDALTARKQRALRAAQQEFLNDLPSGTTRVVRAVEEQHYQDAAAALGMNADDVLRTIEGARLHLEDVLGPNGFEGIIPDAHLQTRKDISRAMFQPKERRFMPEEGSVAPHARRSAAVTEMGIARGGKIKQQIMEDTYGAESWDEAAFRDVVIHIVNSEVYQHITGREAPPSPITDEQYRSCKIPWYSDYKEKAPSLSPVAVFKRVFSIGQIDMSRGIAKDEAPPRREIQPEEILRIRTPTLQERWKALLDRAVESSKSGHHRIAAREASLALDLPYKHPLPFFIRALSHHNLGHHADAEADSSACLKLQANHTGALGIRAYSSLALGEMLLAKIDAEAILASDPDDHDGLYVLAEASLRLGEYDVAVNAAQEMLCKNPADPNALRIRSEGLSKLSENQPPLV